MKIRKMKNKFYNRFCLVTLCNQRGCCIGLGIKRFDFRNYPEKSHSQPHDYTKESTVQVWRAYAD